MIVTENTDWNEIIQHLATYTIWTPPHLVKVPVVRGAGGEDVDAGRPQGVLQPVEAGLAQPQHLAQEPGHDHEAVTRTTLGLARWRPLT